MVILYFVRWFNIILVLRFLFQPGRLCTKLDFFVYYYLPYCYLHQTQENENVRSIKEGKIILKLHLDYDLTFWTFYSQTLLFDLTFSEESSSSSLAQLMLFVFFLLLKGVETGAIACIGCKTYFFCSLSIEETLKNI